MREYWEDVKRKGCGVVGAIPARGGGPAKPAFAAGPAPQLRRREEAAAAE